jgi:hypothetical protein
MADIANHILLPWVAPGMAAHIPDSATEQFAEQLSEAQSAAVLLKVKLVVNSSAVEKTARLYGPGDVTGIDRHQIVRVEPRHRTTEFEPNYFPSIEFDRPDFPWLFTPAKADAQGRLRPWLCLVVVRKQAGVSLLPATNQALPLLEIKAPAQPSEELPDLAESHLWAHSQVTGSTSANLKSTLESQPARNVSRLLCARRLDPSTEYVACVVPSFEVGRKAGLNLPVGSSETLAPAWTFAKDESDEEVVPVALPVYYSWEFRTGIDTDFEELVRRLEPREMPQEVGKRPMDISHPGFSVVPPPLPDIPGAVLGLEGALRVVGSQPDEWPDTVRRPFQLPLQTILNTPGQLATKEAAGQDPIVAPPIYGCWHAAAREVLQSAQQPTAWPPAFWLDELNLDPRHRTVAAMGTQVIQDQQEQLMASAWSQLGDIERINQRLRQAQLSRAVNIRYYVRIFSRFPPEASEAFLQVVAPARSRVEIDGPATNPGRQTLAKRLADSKIPSTAISAPLRKMARLRGPINRQYTLANQSGVKTIFSLFNSNPAGRVDSDKGAITVDRISQNIFDLHLLSTAKPGFIWIPAIPGMGGHWERLRVGYAEMLKTFRLVNLAGSASTFGSSHPTPTNTPAGFRTAAKVHHDALTLLFTQRVPSIVRVPIVAPDLVNVLLSSLMPSAGANQATRSPLGVGNPSLRTSDGLAPVMDSPTFPQPMYEALRDLSQDYLFPGLEHVPSNTVQLLQTNAKFIESFMVGLNAELGRELLWRGYPTDQRGTYFRQFWDTAAAGNARLDIPPIHQWGQRALGTTAAGATGDELVLLIRGELLRRYPGTVIYAVKAVLIDGKRGLSTSSSDEAYPIFRGTLDPDVNFIGFHLNPDEVVRGEGWFFVFQQQPTEPRFGLDADPFGSGESGKVPELTSWNDLNWAHLAPSAEALKALSHVPVNQSHLVPTQPDKGTWGRNSAHMAYITKQRLVRIAIHATELLP